MKKNIFGAVTSVAALALLLSGCGTTTVAPSTTDDAMTQKADNTAVVENTVTTLAPTTNANCPAQTTLTVKSTNGAYPAGMVWDTVAFSKALKQVLTGKVNVTLMFANYASDVTKASDLKKLDLADGQGVLSFTFTQTGDNAQTREYTFGNGGDGSMKLYVPGGKSVQLNTAQATGGLTLTSVTDDALCGTVNLKDNFTEVTGTFVAPLK